eukprot:CAMPEP_0194163330 /NCGR_PEP_ID=MMETSP0152-20130528/79987_1 /TAXON_ID=1049557 /ORGANISM="Thalassiothrix antarctica, Strain L6-D1" /LENGTH=155 /DNA_ID=CAMNT_0038873317 /DNA_START=618 /DNA_END=1085 /DNA_ORIENTATION=-
MKALGLQCQMSILVIACLWLLNLPLIYKISVIDQRGVEGIWHVLPWGYLLLNIGMGITIACTNLERLSQQIILRNNNRQQQTTTRRHREFELVSTREEEGIFDHDNNDSSSNNNKRGGEIETFLDEGILTEDTINHYNKEYDDDDDTNNNNSTII